MGGIGKIPTKYGRSTDPGKKVKRYTHASVISAENALYLKTFYSNDVLS